MKFNFSTREALRVIQFSSILFFSSCANNEAGQATTVEKKSGQEESVNKNTEACTLLREEDARAILGDAIQPGMQTTSMCQYVSASDELSKTGENVSLTFHQNAGSEFEKYVSDTETSTGVKTEPVEGIGDKAAWAEGNLIVKKGSDLLVIMVGKKLEKQAHMAAGKKLAASIISRL